MTMRIVSGIGTGVPQGLDVVDPQRLVGNLIESPRMTEPRPDKPPSSKSHDKRRQL